MSRRREDPLPPHNLEAECAVLGSILIDRDAIIRVAPKLRPSDFFDRRHRAIYEAMSNLYARGEPPDFITVIDELDRTVGPEVVPVSYVSELYSTTYTAVHAEYYAEIVAEKATRRRILHALQHIASTAFDESRPISEVITDAMATLNDAIAQERAGKVYSLDELVEDFWKRLDQPQAGSVRTGFRDLDSLLVGMRPGQLIITAARPRIGKSAFAAQVAMHAARRQGIPAGIISLEMHRDEFFDRALAAESGVNMHQYSALPEVPEDATEPELVEIREYKHMLRTRITNSLGRLSGHPLYIYDMSNGSLADVLATAKAMHMQHRIGLLVVDYLQLVTGDKRRHGNRVEEVGEVSRALKQLARQLEIPVLALAQLNRALELRPADQRKPQLSDLRESGSLEADADVVMFIHRPDLYDVPNAEPNVAEIIVAKYRNGPTGKIRLTWLEETAQFVDYSWRKEPDRAA